MGEIFDRVKPLTSLPWTGERLTTGIGGQVEIEHLHRYAFARELCRGLDVLDIASGEGYGSALLAQVSRSVVGVEIDLTSIQHASSAYQQPNLRFLQGDARSIPLPDESIDAIVSFETIEHFYEHDIFLAEVRRVLRPGGRLIISSPERDIYSPAQQAPNPYHVRELTRSEFEALLSGSFRHVALYGQRPCLGAVLVAEASTNNLNITFERRGETSIEASAGLPRPVYWVAVASDSVIRAASTSLYIDTSDVETVYARVRQLELLQPKAEEWRQQVLASSSAYDGVTQQLQELGKHAEEWRQQLLTSNAAGDDLRRQLRELGEHAEGWRQQLLASHAAGDDLRQQLHEMESRAEELRQQLVASHATNDGLHQQLRELGEHAKELRLKMLAHGSEMEDLHGRLASKDVECQGLSEELARKDIQSIEREVTIADQAETLHNTAEFLENTCASLRALEAEREGLRTKLHLSRKEAVYVRAVVAGPAKPRRTGSRMRGDKARSVRDWEEAAAAYCDHLRQEPQDFGIWVQLGHALKEAGHYAAAMNAYYQAWCIDPFDADLLLNLGHLAKLRGDLPGAANFYCRSELAGNIDGAREFENSILLPYHTEAHRRAARGDESFPAVVEQRVLNIHRSRGWHLTAPLGVLWRLISLRTSRIRAERPLGFRDAEVKALEGGASTDLGPPNEVLTAHPIASLSSDVFVLSTNDYSEASTDQDPIDPAFINKPPPSKLWFYLGDTIEWLEVHAQCSGVGRVTSELFFASLLTQGAGAIPCARTTNKPGLASLSIHESAQFLAGRVGTGKPSMQEDLAGNPPRAPSLAFIPAAGDHVLFTGVVWTDDYINLFEELIREGIRFSVVVYDIIPVDSPEFVSAHHMNVFARWLRRVLTSAATVFVSSPVNRDQILRWAILDSTAILAQIIPIVFGSNKVKVEHQLEPTGSLAALGVRERNFVLSVGTIDRRKNQGILCAIWPRLHAALGRDQVPQLVFVGRDDLGLASLSTQTAELVDAGDILVLQGVSDLQLVELYKACSFTVFPSLSEGYGLPVAESLAYGKLCIASDLPVIRDHAGDLPWYVEPGNLKALLETLEGAISDGMALARAMEKIKKHHRLLKWKDTWEQIAGTISLGRESQRHYSMFPSLSKCTNIPSVPEALRQAEKWCNNVNPEVSIIIVNWNATSLTIECIQQIWANTSDLSYEIIIADNGSDPDSLYLLRQFGAGVSLMMLGTNRYFGEANNIAAERAKGRYLCLLNNDAFVQKGWLQALSSTLDEYPDAGAAGPLFLFPNGEIQEAGANISENGIPVRGMRHETLGDQTLETHQVDYISAAALLIRTQLFLKVGGFDMAYEPAYYEDVDLCFKLAAAGHPVMFCPAARVVHIEGAAANGDSDAISRRNALGDINREKFTARWSPFLTTRDSDVLREIGTRLHSTLKRSIPHTGSSKRAVLFSPFMMTPGGGERFLLTIASILAEDHEVAVVTPHPYSQLRMADLARELALDLTRCQFVTLAAFAATSPPDVMITLSNHITPPIAARGKNCVMICQFPFPLDEMDIRRMHAENFGPYRAIIAYSDYARSHILAALSAYQMPVWPVEVIYPPVPSYAGDPAHKRPIILSVGRFFSGGHSKRHDLIINAFRDLLAQSDSDWELHIAGSSIPNPGQIEYLAMLRREAAGLPVVFHINASSEQLALLYKDATLYWHAAGLDVPLTEYPAGAEHFGITILEAMSAGCVPLAFNAGGPREIIEDGVNGMLYVTTGELVKKSLYLTSPEAIQDCKRMANAAIERARLFSIAAFKTRIRHFLFE